MKYIDGIKNDQINASGFGKMMNEAIGSCMRLTIRPTKHIPIYIELIEIPSDGSKQLKNVKWIDIKGINTPFYPIGEDK